MRVSLLAATAAIPMLMSGCAVQKTLTPVGGSRSDGTVTLAYTVAMFEAPKVDWEQGRQAAVRRCLAWGYNNAEAFGGQETHCNAYNGYGNCMNATIKVQYQCTGAAPVLEGYNN